MEKVVSLLYFSYKKHIFALDAVLPLSKRKNFALDAVLPLSKRKNRLAPILFPVAKIGIINLSKTTKVDHNSTKVDHL